MSIESKNMENWFLIKNFIIRFINRNTNLILNNFKLITITFCPKMNSGKI